jgi:hypothetical protein
MYIVILLPGFIAQVLPRSDLTAVFQLYQIGTQLQVRHDKARPPLNRPRDLCQAPSPTETFHFSLIAALPTAFSIELAFCDINSYNQVYMSIYRFLYKEQ